MQQIHLQLFIQQSSVFVALDSLYDLYTYIRSLKNQYLGFSMCKTKNTSDFSSFFLSETTFFGDLYCPFQAKDFRTPIYLF